MPSPAFNRSGSAVVRCADWQQGEVTPSECCCSKMCCLLFGPRSCQHPGVTAQVPGGVHYSSGHMLWIIAGDPSLVGATDSTGPRRKEAKKHMVYNRKWGRLDTESQRLMHYLHFHFCGPVSNLHHTTVFSLQQLCLNL